MVRAGIRRFGAWLADYGQSPPDQQDRDGNGTPVEGRLGGLGVGGDFFGFGDGNQSGVEINESNVMTISSVYRAVDLVSNVFAGAPWPVYRKLGGGALEEAVAHPLNKLMNRRANVETSAFDFRKVMMMHALVRGNGLARKIVDKTGRPAALWQIEPERAELWRDAAGELWLRIEPPADRVGIDEPEFVPYRDIVHIKGMSHNGIIGASIVAYARESLGMTKAAELFGARFYKNDGTSGGVLEFPTSPDDEIVRKNREEVEAWRTGTNQHRILSLRGGVKLTKMSTNPDDAQAVETREFQLGEVARWFGVPPHLIGDLRHATFSNIENLALQFAHFGMKPWIKRWEQEIDYKCLTPREQAFYESRVAIDSIVPIDSKTLSENNSRDIDAGVTNPDEVRLERGKNPRADGLGGKYLAPLNKAPAEIAFGAQAEPVEGQDAGAQPAAHDADPIRAFLPVIVDTASRLADSERAARERAWWSSDADKREEWIGKHRKRSAEAFAPVAEALGRRSVAGMIGDAVAGGTAERAGTREEHINTIADIARAILAGGSTETDQ